VTKFPRTPEQAELDRLFVHDLRSPIAAIATNFGFLKTTPTIAADPMLLETIQDAESATAILQHLVDNMALLSTLESGPGEMAPEVVHLPEAVLGCMDRLRPITSSSEVTVEVGIVPGAPGPRVFAVPQLLRAAVDNLIQTALRHTPRRGVVRVDAHADGTVGVVEIRDGGLPVPPQIGPQLFTRAGQHLAKREPLARYGRGLALLVAGLAAHAGGGSVEAVEREGHNAFRLAFKLAS